MTHQDFNAYIQEIQDHSLKILAEKNSRYSTGDAIHNFQVGGDILGSNPAMAAFSYMTKHLVALRDMCETNVCDPEDLTEKCGDIINYIAIIYAILADCEKEQV